MTSQEKDVRSNSTLWTTRFLMYLLFLFTPTLVVVTEILLKASKVEVFIPGWVQYATIIFSLISCTCVVLMSKCRVLKKVLIIACTIVMIFLEIIMLGIIIIAQEGLSGIQ